MCGKINYGCRELNLPALAKKLKTDIMKAFKDLSRDELWDIRTQICLNSIYVADYQNSYGYDAKCLSDFFDGYAEHLEREFERVGKGVSIDNADNLWEYFCSIEDWSWVKLTDQANAELKLRMMTFEECREFWNEHACDHYCRLFEIHEMGDEEWWNHLASKLGGWNLANAVLNSFDNFNNSDMWFFYDDDNEYFVSFSTKQEMLDVIGEDFFIENLMNEEE